MPSFFFSVFNLANLTRINKKCLRKNLCSIQTIYFLVNQQNGSVFLNLFLNEKSFEMLHAIVLSNLRKYGNTYILYCAFSKCLKLCDTLWLSLSQSDKGLWALLAWVVLLCSSHVTYNESWKNGHGHYCLLKRLVWLLCENWLPVCPLTLWSGKKLDTRYDSPSGVRSSRGFDSLLHNVRPSSLYAFHKMVQELACTLMPYTVTRTAAGAQRHC